MVCRSPRAGSWRGGDSQQLTVKSQKPTTSTEFYRRDVEDAEEGERFYTDGREERGGKSEEDGVSSRQLTVKS